MALPEKFKAMVVSETGEKKFVRNVTEKNLSDLPKGDLTIEVKYSSLNYKDALSATGNKAVTKSYPHTPGIDAAGIVVESSDAKFNTGDEVLVTGYDLGANTSGGYGRYIRVPASWAVKLPKGLGLKDSMVYGTAGFTAALSVFHMENAGVKPSQGEVLVTGATGGVGCLAVGILAKSGYQVVASTGKSGEKEFLTSIGAKEVISREEASDTSNRPILKGRWAGVVDTVGGNILATAIKSARYGSAVTCCGMVASPQLSLSVFPFILRGVNLLGIDSVECPMDERVQIWNKIAGDWKLDSLGTLSSETSLAGLENKINAILKGNLKGRVIVNLEL